jgi:hypothetical protein
MIRLAYLERQRLSSSPDNRSLNIPTPEQRITIRHRRQRTRLRFVARIPKIIIRRNSIPIIRRIQRLVAIDKHVRLHKHLCAVAGVYAIVDFVKVAVVDVARAEADGWGARVDVVPVVVVLGYA